jgi:6-phosphogluconolactonase
LQTNPEIKNPNFLVIHPGGKYLYSVNTVRGNDGKRFEAVSSFAINKTNGILKFINQIPTYGKATCHVSIDHKGRFVLVANMNSDSIISLSLDKSTGRRKSNGLTLSLPAPCCLKWLML